MLMTVDLSNPGLCEQCSAVGLPILLARYAVAPDSVNLGLPTWACGHKVKEIALGVEFHYVLRTLRTGYVYLFYSKNARGSNQWECYTVGQDGCLRLQPTPAMACPQDSDEFACATNGHTNTSVHYIVIEQPQKCGTTWIAFSETKWCDETINEYASNIALRDKRMQTLHPADMAKGKKHNHGAIAEVAALEQIIEYAPDFTDNQLPYEMAANDFTWEDGSFVTTRLDKVSTRYPWHFRNGRAEFTVKHMKARAQGPKGDNTPHILVLWDGIGIAHELNGFRNDAAGWLHKYGDERALQIAALNDIEGIKNALKDAAGNRVRNREFISAIGADAGNPVGGKINQTNLRRKSVNTGDPRYAEAADLGAQWDPHLVPRTYTQRLGYLLHTTQGAQWRSEVDTLKAEVDAYIADRDAKTSKKIEDARAAVTWDEYEHHLDEKAIATFKDKWQALQDEADKIIDQRTAVLVKWLEAPLFIDTLEDYHPTNIEDGVIFEQVVGEALFGIGSSEPGRTKITDWVKEAKASRNNILWRALALNQTVGIEDLNAALALAEQHKAARTVATAANVEGIVAKTLKVFADVHKKTVGLQSANNSAKSAAGSIVFGIRLKPINTRGIDKLVTTVGDFVVRHFKVAGLADHISEKIVQHMLSLRALVDPNESMGLIIAQAGAEPALREHLLTRLRDPSTFLSVDRPKIKTAESEKLKAAWEKFKITNDKAPAAIKDARLAVLVMLIEGLNFQKLLVDCALKNDGKSWWSLAASGMTITSGLFDVASVPAKNLFGAESWSYQKIKLYGGVLSVGATAIGVVFDVADAKKSFAANQQTLGWLYVFKAVGGGANAGLTLATTFTYSAPTIGRLTGSEVYAGAARAVGERAAAIIARRILFMSVGTLITVGVFTIQVFIWVFTPNELKSWCNACAFGKKRDKTWTVKKQTDELTKALKNVGV
jgi:hypothetical protein